MYLQKSRTSPNRNNLKEYIGELYFSSFVVGYTISLKGLKKCGITNFTKICTNYVIDWEELINVDYKPYADTKANPYGMVTIFYTPHYENVEYNYVYNLDTIAKSAGLWEKTDRGYTKEVHMLAESNEIRRLLLKGKTFGGKDITIFDKRKVGDAETLSMIYQHFGPKELNILCSHRDVNKSKDCMEYAFRCWSTDFNAVIDLLDINGPEDKLMKNISNIARSCEQLEVKTRFIFEDMPKVIGKIQGEVMPAVADDRAARDTLDVFYERLVGEGRAPHLNEDYVAILNGQYRLNRKEIYPLNKALIDYFENSYRRDYNLQSFEIRDTMNKNIQSMGQKLEEESLIDTEIYPKEIRPNLNEIKRAYNELYQREFNLLRRFKPMGKRGEKVNWEVGDGRGE